MSEKRDSCRLRTAVLPPVTLLATDHRSIVAQIAVFGGGVGMAAFALDGFDSRFVGSFPFLQRTINHVSSATMVARAAFTIVYTVRIAVAHSLLIIRVW